MAKAPKQTQQPQSPDVNIAKVPAEVSADKIVNDTVNKLKDAGTYAAVNTTEVKKEITSVIMNQTNQEPWYQSRIIITQYVTLLISVLGILGWVIEPEYQEQIIAIVLGVGALVNPLITLYSRFFAKKPIGH